MKENKKMKILYIGDSNTYGFDPNNDGKYKNPWPSLIRSHKLTNQGINGMTLCHVDKEEQYPSLEDSIEVKALKDYDLVIIMLGTNDLKERYNLSVDHFMNTYEDILGKILNNNKDIKILLLPILENLSLDDKWLNSTKKRIAINKRIKQISIQYNVLYFDYGLVELSFDKVHMSKKGHEEFAKRINLFLYQMT